MAIQVTSVVSKYIKTKKNQFIMKNLKNTITKLMLVAFTILSISLIASCSGDDGKDGINGTNGTNGTNGIDGTNGTNGNTGPQGPAGTANVIYSAWIPANFPETGFTGITPTRKYMTIPFPTSIGVPNDILEKYAVFMYFKGFGDGSLYMLPCNFRGANFTVQPNLSFGFLITATSDSAAPLSPYAIDPAYNNKFRYVLIPGGTLAGRGITKSDCSKLSYHEICSMFNITE